MNRREKENGLEFSNFGFSTILLAFVMICIVTISALSLVTANSDYNLSKKVAEKNSAYYKANELAYDQLAEIDMTLFATYTAVDNAHDYYLFIQDALRKRNYGTYQKTKDACTFTYEIPITEGQHLQVVLNILYPENRDDSFYTIETWKSVYEFREYDESDDHLNLIQ